MPRIPRNPGSGKAPVNTPARSVETDKTGMGWGGPPQGASSAPESIQTAPAFTPEHNPGGTVNPTKEARRQKAMRVLDEAMDNGESWPVKVMAADKMLDRLDGKAVSRNVGMTLDEYEQLSDRELADERARLDAALGAGAAPGDGAKVPAIPPNLVN